MPKRKSSRPDEERFPLRLTPRERDALVAATRLRPKIKTRLKEAGDGTQVVEFTRKELGHLDAEIDEAAEFVPGEDRKRLVAVRRKVAEFEEKGFPQPPRRAGAEPLFQFKVTLKEVEPPVWRRFQVRDGSLGDLHEILQAVMGWEDRHLHRFVIDGVSYGRPVPDDEDLGLAFEDETTARLSEVVPKDGKRTRFVYEYDFGGGWRHEARFEGFPPPEPRTKYPRCVEGERACPPEDVGGPYGYAEFLAALADSAHELRDEFAEWNDEFDPEGFSVQEVNEELRQVRLRRGIPGTP